MKRRQFGLNMEKINVSEMFYSIQGEGKTMGIPSVFLRLQSCNLFCNWRKNDIDHFCDTLHVWKKGKAYDYQELLDIFKKEKYIDDLNIGAHLIITGGEPLLQQDKVAEFLDMVNKETPPFIFVECETNGTIMPSDNFIRHISLFNVSPKLSNSSIKKERRYNIDVLNFHARNDESIFKFVVNDEKDLNEIQEDYIERFNIKNYKIYLMPEGANNEELQQKRQWVAEQCKKYGYNYSDRLQIVIWNKATGV